ncbi:DISARM system phospholipase D-like protein DrmC [Agromyces endophyticus]|uniref:DISARM system phospholipase D-like protein DrmC n=1 Tax=Agromyces sp. H17E-10 TaxID=2932244 RepID=UPI001FCF89DD|nr:DISARM system phospholipase D-like protein DrmC [Agromyces sp. H17E-10]UOQ88052.1 DISARM system phospholipase D-like protein DrmC [Agromyces sp. H17E-10]
MSGALEELARVVSPSQALKLASSLEIDGSLSKAASKLTNPAAQKLLGEGFEVLGADQLAAVLRGFAAAAAANGTDLRAVWSGPTFPGDGDHTTAALAHLVDEATEDVFASTYSASPTSAYLKSLWKAIARGVKTTVLVDPKLNGGKTAGWMQEQLYGARFLGFKPGPDGGIQHSKVVIVDSRAAFITSANLSEAAHERNLEAGVIIRDSEFASGMRQRFSALLNEGHLYELAPGNANG